MRRNKLILFSLSLVLMAGLLVSSSAMAVSNEVEEAVNSYFANLPSDNAMIGQKALIEKVKDGEDLFILDIRKAADYKKGHVEGAVNLPWGSGKIADNLDKLPGDEPIYVYCYTGQTANQTVGLLNFAGFEAKSVKFGWNLGITRVDGYKDVVETKENNLNGETSFEINSDIKTAAVDYLNGLSEVSDTMFKNYKISENMLNMLINSEQEMTVLSIRQAKHYSEGHIPGAINIAWGSGMQEHFNQLPKDEKVIVYCYTGQTAGQTVAGLRMLGYDAVSLNGGIGISANKPYGWTNRGYDVVQ